MESEACISEAFFHQNTQTEVEFPFGSCFVLSDYQTKTDVAFPSAFVATYL